MAWLLPLIEAAKEFPAVASAVENLFGALRSKEDPAPHILHLEIVAAAAGLKLNTGRV